MYQERLGAAGYITFNLARTNNRGDGISLFSYSLYHKFDFVLQHSTWCNIQFTLIKVGFFVFVIVFVVFFF